ncbi:hypothetical protein SLS58_004326 [Diplodia intermedia]|uniref:Uncharacterized protein n=1 Tax=Diplodia intermedia TaxID=856260 RepID=A0ABR3TUD0_9PEZI
MSHRCSVSETWPAHAAYHPSEDVFKLSIRRGVPVRWQRKVETLQLRCFSKQLRQNQVPVRSWEAVFKHPDMQIREMGEGILHQMHLPLNKAFVEGPIVGIRLFVFPPEAVELSYSPQLFGDVKVQ